MKFKFILGLATATMLMAASCSQEEISTPVSNGDEATVSLAVNVPNSIQSRAFGDGTTVDQLQYALYKYERIRETEPYTYTYIKLTDETVSNFEGTYNLELKLATGYDYKLVFWADKSGLTTWGKPFYGITFGENEAKMKLAGFSGYISANDEENDAFFAFYDFTVDGDLTDAIELKRPFAQINFLTNDLEDYHDVTGYGRLWTGITVEVTDLPDTLDLMTGEVSSENKESSIFFNETEYPHNETLQEYEDYTYLAMAYYLVGEEQELVSVQLKYYGMGGENLSLGGESKFRTVNNVPVRRNYRTNIYGQVLTSDINLNVEVAPEFEDNPEDFPLE